MVRAGRLPRRVLVLEASTPAGSVALLLDGRGDSVPVPMGAGREDLLWDAAVRRLAEAGLGAGDLEAVVCGAGPGSFTSLRIAAALAKGLAHGAGCPLFAVPSLLLAGAALEAPGAYLLHADAIRGERFILPVSVGPDGIVDADGGAQRVPLEGVASAAAGRHRVAVGASPEPALEHAIVSPVAHGVTRVHPRWLAAPVPLAEWEPAYGRLAEAQVQWEARHGGPLPGAEAAPSA